MRGDSCRAKATAAHLSVALLISACGGHVSAGNEVPPGGDGGADSSPGTRVPSGSIATFGRSTSGIYVFPPRPTANTAPLAKFDGAWFLECTSLALDHAGFLYTLCLQFDSTPPSARVLVFDTNADATRDPIRTLSGPSTGLDGSPTNIAVDAHGYLYVVRDGAYSSVLVFAPGADGDEAPVRTIGGSKTGFNYASTLAVDALGYLYVGNAEGGPVLVFAPDADGDVAPARRIGSLQDIQGVGSLFVTAGQLFVGNQGGDGSILVYDAGATEGAAPLRTIAGSATRVSAPLGLVVDSEGNIAVSVYGRTAPSFLEFFPPNASGNVAPSVTLPGLGGAGIAIAP